MYISYYKHYKKWSVDYIRLREYLGLRVCLENVENKHLEWVEKKYLDFYDFEKCILKVSMEEMDILAKQNQIDCFFDYKIENKLASSGMTRKIIFNIKLTDYGKRQLESNNTKKLHHEFKNILKKEFELQPNDVKYIDQIYTDENAELFIQKLHVIKDAVQSRKDVIVSLKKYIFSILETTLDNKDTDDDNKNVVDTNFEEIKAADQWKDWGAILPLNEETSITTPVQDKLTATPRKIVKNGRIVISKNGNNYTTDGIKL